MAWKRGKTPEPGGERSARGAGRSGQPAGQAGESLIAAGMVLNGDCRTEGPLRVEGHVTGDVRASQLVVAAGGRVDGDVTGHGGGAGGGPGGEAGASGAERTVVIEGRVEGAVDAPRVEVGPEGSVGGGMRVKDAVVRGRVVGGITTEGRLLLDATAVVEGDVIARRLGLTEGGQVFGTIRIGSRPSSEPGAGSGA